MSQDYRFESHNEALNDRQIAPDCPSHTGEEWLQILQAKSQAQGKRLSWHQIKQDPELNHREIMERLGLYASYENKLFQPTVQTQPTAQSTTQLATQPIARPRRQSQLQPESSPDVQPDIVWFKDHNNRKKRQSELKRAPKGCLGKIVTPASDEIWKNQGRIIISKIDENGSERHLDLSQLEIIQPESASISQRELQYMFLGFDQGYHVCAVTVLEDKILVKAKSRAAGDITDLELRLLPKQKVRLFIGLVMIIDRYKSPDYVYDPMDYRYTCENYDYIICDYNSSSCKPCIKVSDSKYYNLGKFRKPSL